MEEKKPSRKEKEFLRHREEILQTALLLFSENGFHNVTMQEIARASEFSVGTIYKFFSNKEDLYRVLIETKTSEFHSRLKDALEIPGSEVERIERFIQEKIHLYSENADLARLYFMETMGASFSFKAGLQEGMRTQYEDILNSIKKVFEKGIKKKLFSDIDPYHLAVALEGISTALLVENLEHPDQEIDVTLAVKIFFSKILLEADMGSTLD